MDFIYGIAGKEYEHNQSFIEVRGHDKGIDKLKKTLTLINKGNSYRIRELKKEITVWRSRKSLYAEQRLDWITKEVKKLEDESTREYFDYDPEGKLIIPAGYWHLMEKMDDNSHINAEMEPILIDGLRSYQKESVIAMMKYKRATGVLATGLGKSRIIATLCVSAVKSGKRVCVIVPTEDLVGQMLETIKGYVENSTGASSKRIPKLGADVMVTTPITSLKHIDKFNMVILDEAQHNPTDSIESIMTEAKNISHVYNLTATPFRTDGLDLAIHAFGGPIVFEKDVNWGIENGWLCNFDAYSVYINCGDASRSRTHTSAYKKLVTSKKFVDRVSGRLESAKKNDRKVIVMFKTLAAAKLVAKQCGERVADANFKKPLHDFQKGLTNVLIATNKLVGEGIDIPDADVLMLCTQNSSDIITLQALGRILRKSENKKKPLVIDFVAVGYKSFENSGKKRATIWKKVADKWSRIDD